MTKNLLKAVVFGALLFAGCDSCNQSKIEKFSQNSPIAKYTPAPKKVDTPKYSTPVKETKTVVADKSISNYHSLTEEVMTEDILSNSPNEVSFDSIGYAGVGVSVNAMVKSFLPNLNKPMFELNSPLNLPLTPNLTKCDAPIETYSENQNPKAGIYFRIKL